MEVFTWGDSVLTQTKSDFNGLVEAFGDGGLRDSTLIQSNHYFASRVFSKGRGFEEGNLSSLNKMFTEIDPPNLEGTVFAITSRYGHEIEFIYTTWIRGIHFSLFRYIPPVLEYVYPVLPPHKVIENGYWKRVSTWSIYTKCLDTVVEQFNFSWVDFPLNVPYQEALRYTAMCLNMLDRINKNAHGNIRVEYHSYMKSDRWARKREIALYHAKDRCQLCNRADNLQVHHRTYERLGNELPEDLTVLCRSCHAKYHGRGKRGIA